MLRISIRSPAEHLPIAVCQTILHTKVKFPYKRFEKKRKKNEMLVFYKIEWAWTTFSVFFHVPSNQTQTVAVFLFIFIFAASDEQWAKKKNPEAETFLVRVVRKVYVLTGLAHFQYQPTCENTKWLCQIRSPHFFGQENVYRTYSTAEETDRHTCLDWFKM